MKKKLLRIHLILIFSFVLIISVAISCPQIFEIDLYELSFDGKGSDRSCQKIT